jgi:hypothetical protein
VIERACDARRQVFLVQPRHVHRRHAVGRARKSFASRVVAVRLGRAAAADARRLVLRRPNLAALRTLKLTMVYSGSVPKSTSSLPGLGDMFKDFCKALRGFDMF